MNAAAIFNFVPSLLAVCFVLEPASFRLAAVTSSNKQNGGRQHIYQKLKVSGDFATIFDL